MCTLVHLCLHVCLAVFAHLSNLSMSFSVFKLQHKTSKFLMLTLNGKILLLQIHMKLVSTWFLGMSESHVSVVWITNANLCKYWI